MKDISRFLLVMILTALLAEPSSAQSNQKAKTFKILYVCQPCGQDCDKTVYDAPGDCPHCHMKLVEKSTVTFKTISPAEISSYVKTHPDVVLLDVRTKEEFEGRANPNYGTLKNAINIPVQELESRLASIAYLKKKKIIVYCSHGHRSEVACYLLTQNGFPDITNMSGGMSVMKPDEFIK